MMRKILLFFGVCSLLFTLSTLSGQNVVPQQQTPLNKVATKKPRPSHLKDNTCGADAGTVTVNNDGGTDLPFVVCWGDGVSVTTNNDFTLPPDTFPNGIPELMYAFYNCPPTAEDPEDDPCFTGFAWTGSTYTDVNDGSTPNTIGANNFWIAPFTPYRSNVPGGTWFFGDCVDVNPEEAVEFLFLNEIEFDAVPDPCNGTVEITVSGGYPEFVPSDYRVTNTGPGDVSVSGNVITISNLTNLDSYSLSVGDDAGCETPFGPETYNSDQQDVMFSYPDVCYNGSAQPDFVSNPGGTFSFSFPPGDGADIDPNTGELSLAISNYEIRYEVNTSCGLEEAFYTINVLPPIEDPFLDEPYTFCEYGNTILFPSGSLGQYNLYDDEFADFPLATGSSFDMLGFVTPGSGSNTFYLSQTDGQCESARIPFDVEIIPGFAPEIDAFIEACAGQEVNVNPTSATGNFPPSFNFYGDAGLNDLLFTGEAYTFIPTADTDLWITENNSGCESEAVMVTVDVVDVPPPTTANQTSCVNDPIPSFTASSGGGTINWYDTDPFGGGQVPVATGSTFTPSVSNTAAGTYTYWLTETRLGCESLASQFTLTVVARPTISLADPVCAGDNLTYAITLTTNAATLTASQGTVTNNGGNSWTVSGIPEGTAVSVTATSAMGGCQRTVNAPAHDCACLPPPPPSSGGDQTVCSDDPIPTLSVSVGAGQIVNWYEAATGGSLLQMNSTTYTPTMAGTYYAEAVTISDDCPSTSRTPVSLTINPQPNLVSANATCAPNLLTYAVELEITNATSLTVNTGNVTDNGGGRFTVSNIAAGTDLVYSATNSNMSCSIGPLNVSAPDCSCPMINPPTPTANPSICTGDPIPAISVTVGPGETADWYSMASGGTPLASNTLSYTPTAAGTYYVLARNTTHNCISARIPLSITENPLPTFMLTTATCAGDLSTYTVVLSTTNATTLSTNEGSVSDDGGGTFTVSGITAGTNLSFTLSNSGTSCQIMDQISAPDCSCPSIPAPTNDGDQAICAGEAIPSLSVTPAPGTVVDWYDATSGGTLLASNSNTYTPTAAGTYYAEARDPVEPCFSLSRTAVRLTINAQPAIVSTTPACEPSLQTYQVTLQIDDAATISVNAGEVANNGGGNFIISNIPIGTILTYTATNASMTCSTPTTDVMPPDCPCPIITPPTVVDNPAICAGDDFPVLSVTVDSDETADWFDAMTGGNSLASGTTSYTPTMAGTYYVAARSTINDCSSERVAISLTVNPLPTFSVQSSNCAEDLLSYSINLTISDGDGLTASQGTVTDEGGGNFTISGVPAETNIDITVNNSSTGCSIDTQLMAPDCSCGNVEAPLSNGDARICSGDPIPQLSVSVPMGATVDWYDAANGGTRISSDDLTYLPDDAGTFYAETRVLADGCTSSQRTAVSLSIDPLPAETSSEVVCAPDLTTYTANLSFSDTDSLAISLGTLTDLGSGNYSVSGIPIGMNLMFTAFNLDRTCSIMGTVASANCPCPTVDAPMSTGDQAACEGDPLPLLTASVNANETIDWYDAAMGGNLLLSGSDTYSPSEAGTFYALARNTINGCISTTRTAIRLRINPLPALSITGFDCAEDLSNYQLNVGLTNADQLSTDVGTVVDNGGGSFSITGVPAGTDINYTATNSTTGCSRSGNLAAPDCSCGTVEAPSSQGDQVICAGDPIPSLRVNVVAGQTVDWYDAPTGGNLVLADNTALLPTVTDTFYAETRVIVDGCLSLSRTPVAFTINEKPELSVADITEPGCNTNTGSIVLAVEGGTPSYRYSLNGTAFRAIPRFNSLPSGNYVAIVEDRNGCSDTTGITLTPPEGVVADAGLAGVLTCNETMFTLDGSGSTGPDGFTYSWSVNGREISTEATTIISAPGSYTLNVAIDGCTDTDVVTITEDVNPPLASIMDPAILTCEIPDLTLDGSGSTTGDSISYQWLRNGAFLDGENGPTLPVNDEAVYVLQVINDNNGCNSFDTIVVIRNEDFPLADAGADQTLTCIVEEVTLDGSNSQSGSSIVYRWQDAAGNDIADANTSQLLTSQVGSYTLIVQDTMNGCSNEDVVFVNINQEPPIVNIAEPDELPCVDPSVTLVATVSGGNTHSFSWEASLGGNLTGPLDQATTSTDTPGNYQLTVTRSDNGCTASDAVSVSQVMVDFSSLELISNDPACLGDQNGSIEIISIDPNHTYTSILDGGTPSEINFFSGLGAGSYQLQIQDEFGCQLDTTITLNEGQELQVVLPDELSIDFRDSVLLEALVAPLEGLRSVSWSPSFLVECDTCLLTLTSPLDETTDFYLQVANENGCVASESVRVIVHRDRLVYVPTAFSPNGDERNDTFFPFAGSDEIVRFRSMRIFNRWGEIVHEAENFAINDERAAWNGNSTSGEPYNPGVFVYMLEVEYINGIVELLTGELLLMR